MTFHTAEEFDSDKYKLYNDNFFNVLPTLESKSVDLVFADLPYNCTDCAWDKEVIDLEKMWIELKRIAKSDRTPFIFTCTTQFGYELIKSNPKWFKMDMVWKKRNKTGGLQSRFRPMRNHEMIYFFYKKAPLYNRDKYHKRIKTAFVKAHSIPKHATELGAEHTKNGKDFLGNNTKEAYQSGHYDPPSIASVVDDAEMNKSKEGGSIYKIENDKTPEEHKKWKEEYGSVKYEPVNPGSVIEEKTHHKGMPNPSTIYKKKFQSASKFEPVNPSSIIEPKDFCKVPMVDPNVNEKGKSAHGYDIEYMNSPRVAHFDPKLPASVLESPLLNKGKKKCNLTEEQIKEIDEKCKVWGYNDLDPDITNRIKGIGDGTSNHFEPKLPASCFETMTEDMIDSCYMCTCGVEPEVPQTVYESKKVFIGKRNHQTEKPVDLMEFILKYWSKENDTILDHTMGSGSMGVACTHLNRKFIGCEMNEKIYKVAVKRVTNKK